MLGILDGVIGRWQHYEAAAISQEIADLFAGDTIESYLLVGRSGIGL
jgi:hypothetical protein